MDGPAIDTSAPQTIPSPSRHFYILYIFSLIATLTVGIAIGFYMNKANLTQQHPSISPNSTPTATSSPTPTNMAISPSPELVSKLSFTIPSNWKTYSKNFQNLHFTFSYPPNYVIEDGDQDSGDIYMRATLTAPYAFAIGRLSYYGIPEYVSGGRREWFVKGAQSVNSSLNLSLENYIFTPLDFANGNSYYLIGQGKLINGQPAWLSEPGASRYFGIFNSKSILITDYKVLSHDDALRIMQSLKVN